MKVHAALLLCLFAGAASAQTTIRPGGSSGGGATPATITSSTYCPDSGSNDTFVCSLPTAPTAYEAGMLVTLRANTVNTGTATIDVNSLGVKNIVRCDGTTLQTGDIGYATQLVYLAYDGTSFRDQNTCITSVLSPASGGITVRAINYTSGSSVPLTVQGSLTGNILNAITSGSTNVWNIGVAGKVSQTMAANNVLMQWNTTGTTRQFQFEHSTSGADTFGFYVSASSDLSLGTSGGYQYRMKSAGGVIFSAAPFTTSSTAQVAIDNRASAIPILGIYDNGTLKFKFDDEGQPVYSTTVPAVSNTSANSCGTTAATIAGTNETGVITVGATSGTSCTLTFAIAAPTRRQCMATNETSGLAVQSTYSSTTVSILAGTYAASDKIAYICQVY